VGIYCVDEAEPRLASLRLRAIHRPDLSQFPAVRLEGPCDGFSIWCILLTTCAPSSYRRVAVRLVVICPLGSDRRQKRVLKVHPRKRRIWLAGRRPNPVTSCPCLSESPPICQAHSGNMPSSWGPWQVYATSNKSVPTWHLLTNSCSAL
jgi:hypothetical protein